MLFLTKAYDKYHRRICAKTISYYLSKKHIEATLDSIAGGNTDLVGTLGTHNIFPISTYTFEITDKIKYICLIRRFYRGTYFR